MFRRDKHKTIALILSFLDSASLGNSKCYFGGGTAMAMLHGEYRTSFDLDFLVSDSESFSSLRALVRSEGLISLFDLEHRQLLSSSPARIDQYGIRSSLRFLDTEIKFEIIREGRIEFEIPLETDQILGITTLTETDLIAEKLMANSDRYQDQGVFSRDIIDLAFAPVGDIRNHRGFSKAESAYGKSIEKDLLAALQYVLAGERLERSMKVLEIEEPPAQVRQRLIALKESLII
jgi:predicted nucleotidyltransferase component of viral defense system